MNEVDRVAWSFRWNKKWKLQWLSAWCSFFFKMEAAIDCLHVSQPGRLSSKATTYKMLFSVSSRWGLTTTKEARQWAHCGGIVVVVCTSSRSTQVCIVFMNQWQVASCGLYACVEHISWLCEWLYSADTKVPGRRAVQQVSIPQPIAALKMALWIQELAVPCCTTGAEQVLLTKLNFPAPMVADWAGEMRILHLQCVDQLWHVVTSCRVLQCAASEQPSSGVQSVYIVVSSIQALIQNTECDRVLGRLNSSRKHGRCSDITFTS